MGNIPTRLEKFGRALERKNEELACKHFQALSEPDKCEVLSWRAERTSYSALHYMVEAGMTKMMTTLLDRNVDPDLATNEGLTLLHLASEHGHFEIVKKLLAKGADFTCKDTEHGNTPLHLAAMNGNFEVIAALLDAGAPLEDANSSGVTPLVCAAGKGNAEAVRVLCERGANLNSKDHQGWNALHWAAFRGHSECCGVLINNEIDVTAKILLGNTAMHMAAFRGHLQVLQTFARLEVPLDMTNARGQTPLELAREAGQRHVISFLKRATNVEDHTLNAQDRQWVAVEHADAGEADDPFADLAPAASASFDEMVDTWHNDIERTMQHFHETGINDLQVVSVCDTSMDEHVTQLIDGLHGLLVKLASSLSVEMEERKVSLAKFKRICQSLGETSAVLVVYVESSLRQEVGQTAMTGHRVSLCTAPVS